MTVSSSDFNVDDYVNDNIPIVFANRLVTNCEMGAVISDHINGAYHAVKMNKRTPKNRHHIWATRNLHCTGKILTGYLRALNDFNIEVNED